MKITKKEIKNIALDKVPSALAVVTDNEKTYKKYYLTTKKHKTMIVVNFYEVGKLLPSYRLFCTKEDYMTQDLTQKPYILKRSALSRVTPLLNY